MSRINGILNIVLQINCLIALHETFNTTSSPNHSAKTGNNENI